MEIWRYSILAWLVYWLGLVPSVGGDVCRPETKHIAMLTPGLMLMMLTLTQSGYTQNSNLCTWAFCHMFFERSKNTNEERIAHTHTHTQQDLVKGRCGKTESSMYCKMYMYLMDVICAVPVDKAASWKRTQAHCMCLELLFNFLNVAQAQFSLASRCDVSCHIDGVLSFRIYKSEVPCTNCANFEFWADTKT